MVVQAGDSAQAMETGGPLCLLASLDYVVNSRPMRRLCLQTKLNLSGTGLPYSRSTQCRAIVLIHVGKAKYLRTYLGWGFGVPPSAPPPSQRVSYTTQAQKAPVFLL